MVQELLDGEGASSSSVLSSWNGFQDWMVLSLTFAERLLRISAGIYKITMPQTKNHKDVAGNQRRRVMMGL
jgi:hypothetical protein